MIRSDVGPPRPTRHLEYRPPILSPSIGHANEEIVIIGIVKQHVSLFAVLSYRDDLVAARDEGRSCDVSKRVRH